MTEDLSFSAAPVSEISKSLNKYFEPSGRSAEVTRASNTNFLILGASTEDTCKVTKIAELLGTVHPARFFIVISDKNCEMIRAETAILRVNISTTSSVCSEMIRLFVPKQAGESTPSLIRANILPGLPTKLLICQWLKDREIIDGLLPEVDEVLFDSRDFEKCEDFWHRLLHDSVDVIDVNWVRLACWRQAVRELFDRTSLIEQLPYLSEIKVISSGSDNKDFNPSTMMLSGWILDRLGLEPIAYGRNGFECIGRRTHKPMTLNYEIKASTTQSQIEGIEMTFKDSLDSEVGSVVMTRNGSINTVVRMRENLTIRRKIEAENIEALIERLFLVGESSTNLISAIRIGLEMQQMRKGFDW